MGAGAPCPFWFPQKMRGSRAPTGASAEAPHPVTVLADRSISGSPEITGGIAHRRASRRSAAAFSLRRRAALFSSALSAAWQEDIAPGRSPDAARAPADEAEHPGATPAKARISPGARRRDRLASSPAALPDLLHQSSVTG